MRIIVTCPPQLADLAIKYHLPTLDPTGGALIRCGVNSSGMRRRAASYVNGILKGAKPADMPIEAPARCDFVVNLKTAQALGLTIPQSVLIQATEVIP